jgi:hypothetical protein
MPRSFPAAKNRHPLMPAKFANFAKFAKFANFAIFGMVDALLGHPASGRLFQPPRCPNRSAADVRVS